MAGVLRGFAGAELAKAAGVTGTVRWSGSITSKAGISRLRNKVAGEKSKHWPL